MTTSTASSARSCATSRLGCRERLACPRARIPRAGGRGGGRGPRRRRVPTCAWLEPGPRAERSSPGDHHVHRVGGRSARTPRPRARPFGRDPQRTPRLSSSRDAGGAGGERDRRRCAEREQRHPASDPRPRCPRPPRVLRLGGQCDHAERQDRRIAAHPQESDGSRAQPGIRFSGARRSRRGGECRIARRSRSPRDARGASSSRPSLRACSSARP